MIFKPETSSDSNTKSYRYVLCYIQNKRKVTKSIYYEYYICQKIVLRAEYAQYNKIQQAKECMGVSRGTVG